MVQMKDHSYLSCCFCLQLYIPHGSDESWYKAHLRKFHIKLYIPHGSDERQIQSIKSERHLYFISHMVQMKGQTLIKKPIRLQLYIPHGSDESPLYHQLHF